MSSSYHVSYNNCFRVACKEGTSFTGKFEDTHVTQAVASKINDWAFSQHFDPSIMQKAINNSDPITIRLGNVPYRGMIVKAPATDNIDPIVNELKGRINAIYAQAAKK